MIVKVCDVYVSMCYVIVMIMFYVLCHKGPGVLQVIKVTAHIRATLTKAKVDDPPWC